MASLIVPCAKLTLQIAVHPTLFKNAAKRSTDACVMTVPALKFGRPIRYVLREIGYDATDSQNSLRSQPANKFDIALVCRTQQIGRRYGRHLIAQSCKVRRDFDRSGIRELQ